jgi:hypothetical protein
MMGDSKLSPRKWLYRLAKSWPDPKCVITKTSHSSSAALKVGQQEYLSHRTRIPQEGEKLVAPKTVLKFESILSRTIYILRVCVLLWDLQQIFCDTIVCQQLTFLW